MTFVANLFRRRATDAEAAVASADRAIVDLRPMWIGTAAICAFFIGLRAYEQAFGWSRGMDSNTLEFERSWMSIFYSAVALELIALIALIAYLVTTRDRGVPSVAPREELRRTFYLLGWLMMYGLAFTWGASYFTEQDAAWHSAALRDSAFTPVNIIKFYVSYPLYIIIGVGAFLYARTRLPTFACKGYSIAFALLLFGPFMILPSAALSEWGGTFWYMEELFVAPLHWTFVFFGWFSLAVFGVSLQVLERMREICTGEEKFAVVPAVE